MVYLKKEDKDWYKDLIIYQIYPKSFMDSNNDGIGDIDGIISKLDYLQDLGVNAIWLSPIYTSPCFDNGYDIADYEDIDPQFGSLEDLYRLRDEAHRRNIHLIMDLVINHTSHLHRWFQESRKSRDNEYSDYYIWKDPVDGKEPNNWGACFGGSAWEYEPSRNQYYLHLFAKEQPDLNWKSEKVKNSIFSMIRKWLDLGIDGFRVDAISYLDKGDFSDSDNPLNAEGYAFDMDRVSNREGTHEIIHEIGKILDEYDAFSVGEVNIKKLSDYRDYTSRGRMEFNMVIPFVAPIVEISSWSPGKMKENIIQTYEEVKDDGWWARFLSNHDKPRQISLYGDDKTYRKESAKMLALLLHTLPGTPFIFQGEEIGMTNVRYPSIEYYNDIDTLNVYRSSLLEGKTEEEAFSIASSISRDNARTPMQWNSQEGAGFTRGTPWLKINENYRSINVAKELEDEDSILHFYKRLVSLRRSEACIRRGSLKFLEEKDEDLFIYTRSGFDSEFLVILNFSDSEKTLALPSSEWTAVLHNYRQSPSDNRLRPFEACIYRHV